MNRKLVAQDGDTYFFQENFEQTPARVWVDITPMDWLELARQKQTLLKLVWDVPDHPLWGLVHLLDHIMDEADNAGHPVVWATAKWEESEK